MAAASPSAAYAQAAAGLAALHAEFDFVRFERQVSGHCTASYAATGGCMALATAVWGRLPSVGGRLGCLLVRLKVCHMVRVVSCGNTNCLSAPCFVHVCVRALGAAAGGVLQRPAAGEPAAHRPRRRRGRARVLRRPGPMRPRRHQARALSQGFVWLPLKGGGGGGGHT